MDINTLRGLSTILVLLAFIGICWWAFSPKRRKKFDEAAKLPFADEPNDASTRRHSDEQGEDAEPTKHK